MLTAPEFRSRLRRVKRRDYPELAAYSRDEIYGSGDNMAPGGLYLAARMCRGLELTMGDRVLDLGCGRGDSSVFLARMFGARVAAADLWVSPAELAAKFDRRGVGDVVMPLQLDARSPLPFADEYFDAVFCMQAFYAFGTTQRGLTRILRHLRPGGRLVIGTTCFNEEPANGLPEVYRNTDGWNAEYAKYHSPPWWADHFRDSGLVDVIECVELDDGVVLWEDEFAYSGDRVGWTDEWFDGTRWLAEQLAFGRERRPYLTHLVATVEKRPGSIGKDAGEETGTNTGNR
jgi:SAM-dependent methyltransferase